MTNAHAIVPGMLPSLTGRSNTAWQVGLAAGLAATANLRPPNPALGHQAAASAAAARAAAAFQASRALSMAKSQAQQSPLLQQGSASAASGELNLSLISLCDLELCCLHVQPLVSYPFCDFSVWSRASLLTCPAHLLCTADH